MTNYRLTGLTSITAASTDDNLYIVDSPGSSPASRKITFDALQKSITAVNTSLTTGLLKVTTSTGALSTASAGTDYEAALTKGDLTAGSAKISIGGTGTDAVIGAGATVDLGSVASTDLSDTANIARLASPNTFTEAVSLSSMTANSILFAGTSGVISQDNTNLTFNDSTDTVGVKILSATAGVSAANYVSTAAIGTAPYSATSTTLNPNLNADLWDGYQFTDYLDQAVKAASSPTFANLSITSNANVGGMTSGSVLFAGTSGLISQDNTNLSFNDSTDTLGVKILSATAGVSATNYVSTVATGTAPYAATSTTVNNNLNADLWDGYQFADYLDQAVKTTNSPSFVATSVTTNAVIGATDANAELVFGVAVPAAARTFTLRTNSADGNDTGTLVLTSGGAAGTTRGAGITLKGDDVGGAGAGAGILYEAGTGTTGTHSFLTEGTEKWSIGTTGILTQNVTNGGNIEMKRSGTGILISNSNNVISSDITDACGAQPQLCIQGTMGANDQLVIIEKSNNSGGPQLKFFKTRNADGSADTIVQSGDGVGSITFFGANGAAYKNAASIKVEIDATPGVNDMPGRLVFMTTPDDSQYIRERWRIDSTGALKSEATYGGSINFGKGGTGIQSGTNPIWHSFASYVAGAEAATGWVGLSIGHILYKVAVTQ